MHLVFRINQAQAIVYEYLTDAQKFVKVHPVIYKAEKISEQKYVMYERLGIGILSCPFSYPVEILSHAAEQTIEMKAVVMKIVAIEIKFSLTTEGNYTIVNEEVTFKSWLPIAGIMGIIFKKYHRQLFENIAQIQNAPTLY